MKYLDIEKCKEIKAEIQIKNDTKQKKKLS